MVAADHQKIWGSSSRSKRLHALSLMIVKIQIEGVIAERESGRSSIHAVFTIPRIFNYN